MTDEKSLPCPAPDTRAAIVQAVQRWNASLNVAAGRHTDPGIESNTADTTVAAAIPPARARGVLVLRAAARRAQQLYPGAVGELIRRELLAVADFNHGPIGEQSLVARLADQILRTDLTSSPDGDHQHA